MAVNGTQRTGDSLSDFQRRKQEYIFDTLYDITHDRNLSRQDFTKLQKIWYMPVILLVLFIICIMRLVFLIFKKRILLVTGLKGLSGRCEQSRQLQTRMASIWSGLMKSSRHYRKNPLQLHLSLSEWMSYWSDFVKAASKCRDWPATSIDEHATYSWHTEFVDFVFDVMDQNNDDVISKEEYVTSLSAFSVPVESCQDSYTRVTQELNGNQLDRVSFKSLWFGYITSDDQSAACNFLFGDPSSVDKDSKEDS